MSVFVEPVDAYTWGLFPKKLAWSSKRTTTGRSSMCWEGRQNSPYFWKGFKVSTVVKSLKPVAGEAW